MVPWKDGKANHGHSCVKGRFAWGYATHKERILEPMIRRSIEEPVADGQLGRGDRLRRAEFTRIEAELRRHAIGGITSSRCTNEETYLVQKMIRARFGVNNVDTCARVCHSPTGYGLKTTLGTSAGTQDFDSVDHCDVMVVIGANPTDGHPVFASRMKKRLRAGAKLIVIDPRRIDLVRTPHVEAAHHLPLKPGTNVAVLVAMAHVIVTEGLVDEPFVRERCDLGRVPGLGRVRGAARAFPRGHRGLHRRAGAELRAARGSTPPAAMRPSTTACGVTEHSQGSTAVMAIANLAMATGNYGKARASA
jgi:formate dehydrogenase major subunit